MNRHYPLVNKRSAYYHACLHLHHTCLHCLPATTPATTTHLHTRIQLCMCLAFTTISDEAVTPFGFAFLGEWVWLVDVEYYFLMVWWRCHACALFLACFSCTHFLVISQQHDTWEWALFIIFYVAVNQTSDQMKKPYKETATSG